MIGRGVLMIHEMALGLPEEVLDLATAIYGGSVDGTECRYDSTTGYIALYP